MSDNEIYCERDGYIYIRVEPTEVAREMQSLKLAIELARDKIATLRQAADGDTQASEDVMDDINDLEMLIDDVTVYLQRLQNMPRGGDTV